jgi:hypothetical protein
MPSGNESGLGGLIGIRSISSVWIDEVDRIAAGIIIEVDV